MNRYLCLHLHFYQPPRENPWLDEIEYQESAYPFHDWNERIDMECYRANGTSRILDSEGRVIDLANNYAKVNFNFGPTLLSWLEKKDQKTYERILEGDRLSQAAFGGHGNAIAQCYNHTIMPLTNARDKETQVLWGLHDFQRRFGRDPEAMWLPETAVDTASLEILSANGMKYVILAPRQAHAVRPLNSDQPWTNVEGEKVDPREPYLINLPSGRKIAAFFYDGPISKAVAFEGLLHNGEGFANRLLSGFDSRNSNQLLHIATDGETYGHHHINGDMALAYAIHHLEQNKLATITNYGQYLELNPPTKEAQIHEDSSWSCSHGIDRWRQDCGCNSGSKPGWHQRWRKPLREALDKVRDEIAGPFEAKLQGEFGIDAWAMRNDYIRVIENRSLSNIDSFLKKWTDKNGLRDSEASVILKALEAQRHLLLMFTSCAWFFDEVSGIETIQNLQYAYRAIELSERAFGIKLLEPFMKDLESAESNLPEIESGREAFEKYALPSRVDNLKVGSHFAVASIFENFGIKNEVYNNKITLIEFLRLKSGKAHVAFGHARIRSRTTLDRNHILFGVLHFGDHNISGGIKKFESQEEYENLVSDARRTFEHADFPATLRIIDSFFGTNRYSLRDLFKDEQRKFIDIIMNEAMTETEERFQRLYRNNYSLLAYLTNMNIPVPKVFSDISEFVQNRGLKSSLGTDAPIRISNVRGYLDEARKWQVPIDGVGVAHELEDVLEQKMDAFAADDTNFSKLLEILQLVGLSEEMPSKVNLGPVQNWFWLWYRDHKSPENPTTIQREFENVARQLADRLKIRLPAKERLENETIEPAVSGDLSPSASKDISV